MNIDSITSRDVVLKKSGHTIKINVIIGRNNSENQNLVEALCGGTPRRISIDEESEIEFPRAVNFAINNPNLSRSLPRFKLDSPYGEERLARIRQVSTGTHQFQQTIKTSRRTRIKTEPKILI